MQITYRGELTKYYLDDNIKIGDAYTITEIQHKPKLEVRVSILTCEGFNQEEKPLFSVLLGEVKCK